jgi:hypothetical protein
MSQGIQISPQPYWVDELRRKHEGLPYDDAGSEIRSIEHAGHSLRLIVRKYTPAFQGIEDSLRGGPFISSLRTAR